MRQANVTVINRLGLHARAAAQLVKVAGGYRSHIRLVRPGTEMSADARSILNVLTLSASRGCELRIEVDGEDSEAALEAIQALFSSGFGEV